MINERISELGSAIIKLRENDIEVIGFMSQDRLEDYYNKDINCVFSHGIYPLDKLDFSYAQDNALFIILDKLGNEKRIQFKILKKDTVKYKSDDKKILSKVYKIRKCNHTNIYNFQEQELSILFKTKDELLLYFQKRFNSNLIL